MADRWPLSIFISKTSAIRDAIGFAAGLSVLTVFAAWQSLTPELVFGMAAAIAAAAGAAIPHSTMLAMRTADETSTIALAFVGSAKLILSAVLSGLLALAALGSSFSALVLVLMASIVALMGLAFARAGWIESAHHDMFGQNDP